MLTPSIDRQSEMYDTIDSDSEAINDLIDQQLQNVVFVANFKRMKLTTKIQKNSSIDW